MVTRRQPASFQARISRTITPCSSRRRAILAAFGTNGVEQMTPANLAHYTSGIGLSFPQVVAVFCVSAFLGAVRFINASTEDTNPPIPKP